MMVRAVDGSDRPPQNHRRMGLPEARILIRGDLKRLRSCTQTICLAHDTAAIRKAATACTRRSFGRDECFGTWGWSKRDTVETMS